MPSSIQFSTALTTKSSKTSIYTRPAKKQKMSITQTYFLAHSARGKLSKEAARADHDLRLLVGHANMLDHLMIDLANAEQEQERWFNKSLSGASEAEEEEEEEDETEQIETIVEEPEADWRAEDAEISDDEEEDSTVSSNTEVDDDMEMDDETDGELTLTRTPSRHSPPELSHDSDSDSEDEQMPPSPPQQSIATFSEKQRQAIATTSFYDRKEASLSEQEQQVFEHEAFYLQTRDQPTLVAAY